MPAPSPSLSRGMILTASAPSTRKCFRTSLPGATMALSRTKYLTFGIDADSIKAAKPRLERIETDILNNFKRLGVAAETLDGKGAACPASRYLPHGRTGSVPFRLELAGGQRPVHQGFYRTVRFRVPHRQAVRMGKKYGAVSFLQILAPELNDRMLADFLDMESSLIVSLHIQSVDQVKAIKTVKRKSLTWINPKSRSRKKAVRAGTTWTLSLPTLPPTGPEAKKLLQDLQSRNERMFLVTFLIMTRRTIPASWITMCSRHPVSRRNITAS